jgi:hypothetical protein
MSKRVFRTNWWELRNKWKGILISKRHKTAESNNKSQPSKDRKLHFNSNFSDFKEESPNSKCKSEADNDFKQFILKKFICLIQGLWKNQLEWYSGFIIRTSTLRLKHCFQYLRFPFKRQLNEVKVNKFNYRRSIMCDVV